jgi:sucrose phosphorylase
MRHRTASPLGSGIGYAIKKAGTTGFMIPETFAFIADFTAQAHALGIEVLVEIHGHYQEQIDIAARVDWVYDFALTPLVLHFQRSIRWRRPWPDFCSSACC